MKYTLLVATDPAKAPASVPAWPSWRPRSCRSRWSTTPSPASRFSLTVIDAGLEVVSLAVTGWILGVAATGAHQPPERRRPDPVSQPTRVT
jgi:hypothetical protein